MLTKTSISAIRTLTYLGLQASEQPLSPRLVARQLGESPSYLAKVMRHLVRSGILRAHRGAAGGVTLNRRPEEISLRMIVEACQGAILADFCEGNADELAHSCAFHQAAAQLHEAIMGVLQRWTLADLLRKPHPDARSAAAPPCLMGALCGTPPAAAIAREPVSSTQPAGRSAAAGPPKRR